MGIFSPFHFSVLVILGLLYFLPWFVGRKKRNSSAIFWLNFFLGWTGVGWVAALIWGLKTDPQSTPVVVNQADQELSPMASITPVPEPCSLLPIASGLAGRVAWHSKRLSSRKRLRLAPAI